MPLRDRFAISPMIDLEIDVCGFGWAGLAADVDHDLRKDITSAVLMRVLNCSFVTAKKYAKDMSEHVSRDKLVRDIFSKHWSEIDDFYKSIDPRSDGPIGVFAFDMIIVRSQEILKLILNLSRQGFLIEPALICRSLLEQFSYAAAVWGEESHDRIFALKPQSLINNLKTIVPNSGRAYGLLSELSHYHPDRHYNFLEGLAEPRDDDFGTDVIQRSWKFKIMSLAWFMYILHVRHELFMSFYGTHKNCRISSKSENSIASVFDEFFADVPITGLREVRELF